MARQHMKRNIRLSTKDIQIKRENALDLFYSGIKSKETKRTMEGNLKVFLVDACVDILQGNFMERAQQFVNLAKEDQQQAVQVVLAYVAKLRERTRLDKLDSDYLNPSTIPNKIKPIRKLLDMNNLGLAWKRIYSTYPELDNKHQGRGYSLEELRKIYEYSDSIETDFIILASSSGGLRVGAWDNLTWGCVFPIYQVGNDYKTELGKDEEKKTVCAGMTIYKGTTEEYDTLISIEAWDKVEEYRKTWTKKTGRLPVDSDPLILEHFTKPRSLTSIAVKKRIEGILVRSGIRTPLTEGKRRHTVPATHGFRRYWDKVMMNSLKKKDTLGALVLKERLMGHDGLVHTDKNYYWTNILDSVPHYLEVMPYLMISEEIRLKKKLEDEKLQLERFNHENNEVHAQLRQLEMKVERLTRYQQDHRL